MGFNEKYNRKIEIENENKLKTPMSPNTKSENKKSIQNTEIQTTENTLPQLKSPLMLIKQFIKVLSSPFFDGRVLLNIDQTTKSTLKFMLLNPDACFEDIMKQARSIILAGGTMKPVI